MVSECSWNGNKKLFQFHYFIIIIIVIITIIVEN